MLEFQGRRKEDWRCCYKRALLQPRSWCWFAINHRILRMENELLRDRQLANVIAKDHFPVRRQQPFPSLFPYSSPTDTGVILYWQQRPHFLLRFSFDLLAFPPAWQKRCLMLANHSKLIQSNTKLVSYLSGPKCLPANKRKNDSNVFF